jgi:hypothetical protein
MGMLAPIASSSSPSTVTDFAALASTSNTNDNILSAPDVFGGVGIASSMTFSHGVYDGSTQTGYFYLESGTTISLGSQVSGEWTPYSVTTSSDYPTLGTWIETTLKLAWYNATSLRGLLYLNNTSSSPQTLQLFYDDLLVTSNSQSPVVGSWRSGVITACFACSSEDNAQFVSTSFTTNMKPASYYVGSSNPQSQITSSGVLNNQGSFSPNSKSNAYVGAQYSIAIPARSHRIITLSWGYAFGTNYLSSGGFSLSKSGSVATSMLSVNFSTILSQRRALWNRWLSQVPSPPDTVNDAHNITQYYHAWAEWLSLNYPAQTATFLGGTVINSMHGVVGSPSKGVFQAYDGFYVVDGWMNLIPMLYYDMPLALQSVALYDSMDATQGIVCGGIWGSPTAHRQDSGFGIITWMAYLASGDNVAWLRSVFSNVNDSMTWWYNNRFNATYSLWWWSTGGSAGWDEADGDKPSAYADGNVSNVAFAPDASGLAIMNLEPVIQMADVLGYTNTAKLWTSVLGKTLTSVDKYLWSNQYQDYFALEKNGSLKVPGNGGKYFFTQTVLAAAGLDNLTRVQLALQSTANNRVLLPPSPDEYIKGQVLGVELSWNYPGFSWLTTYQDQLLGAANWSPIIQWHYGGEILYWFNNAGLSL